MNGPSREEIRIAVLQVLSPSLLQFNTTTAFLGECTLESVQAACERAASIREWVATLDNREIRKAYTGWLEFFETGYREAEEELRFHRRRLEHEKWQAEQDAKNDGVSIALETIPRPPV